MNKISVVVPCFNEEEVLSVFYKKTKKALAETGQDIENDIKQNGGMNDESNRNRKKN